MTDENTSGFTAAEEAYFSSGGDESALEVEVAADEAEQHVPEADNNGHEDQEAPRERSEKGGFVPHGAFHAERTERKKAEAEKAELAQKLAIFEDRWNTMLAANKPQQDEVKEETPPDPKEDFIAYMEWQGNQIARMNEEKAAEARQRHEAEQQQQQEQVIWSTWDNSVNQAKSSLPDFDEATGYLAQLRDSQLQAFSSVDPNFANPQARVAQINAELRQIIIQAKQAGQDPATAVYQIAKGYGYTTTEHPSNDGKVEKIIQAQAGSKTIAGTNGNAMADPLSAQAILDMPAAEFDAWVQNPANAKRLDKILQGM